MKSASGINIPRTLEEVCDPQHVALLVYDMQVGILSQIKNPEQITLQAGSDLGPFAQRSRFPETLRGKAVNVRSFSPKQTPQYFIKSRRQDLVPMERKPLLAGLDESRFWTIVH